MFLFGDIVELGTDLLGKDRYCPMRCYDIARRFGYALDAVE